MSSGIPYGSSWLEICNRALGRIGVDRISSLDGGGDFATKCLTFLGEAIETVLTAHPWFSLRKRVELARLATDPAFGFSYQYQLPNDFLVPVEVWLDGDLYDPASGAYVIEAPALLSSAETVYLLYVSRPTNDVTVLPGYIKTAIETQLAALIATSARSGEVDKAIGLARVALEDAILADSRRAPRPAPADSWTDAR